MAKLPRALSCAPEETQEPEPGTAKGVFDHAALPQVDHRVSHHRDELRGRRRWLGAQQPLSAAACHLLPLRRLRRRRRRRCCPNYRLLLPRERRTRTRAHTRARAAPALARRAPQPPHRPHSTLAEPPLLRHAPRAGPIVLVDPAVLVIALVIPRPRRAAVPAAAAASRVQLLLVPPLAPPLPPAARLSCHRAAPGGAERPPRAPPGIRHPPFVVRDLRDLI